MDGSTSQDVTRAITAFTNKNRIPAKIVVHAGPKLKALSNNQLFDAATAMGIPVQSVAAGHQFLNFSERQIQVWKGLMGSMKRSQNKTIYDQENTMLDLQEKLSKAYKVMSLRPILIKHKDEEETVILAAQVSQPTLSSRNVEAMMTQMLLGEDSIQHQLYSYIPDYKEGLLEAFHTQLLLYLQENSVFYKNEKHRDRNAASSLIPKIGDFVVYKDSGKKIHFGIIDQIMTGSQDNVVSLRVIKFGKVTHQ